jgi:hypothetical protein
VVAQQLRSREMMSGLAVESAANIVDQLKRAMNRARDEQVTTMMGALSGDGREGDFVRAASLRAEVNELERALGAAREQYAGLDLKRAFEADSMAIQFEMIDQGTPERVTLTQQQHLLVTVSVGFLFSLLLSALIVGVFDPRVYDDVTVKRLDLQVVGHIP